MVNKVRRGVFITPKFSQPSGGNTFSGIILSVLKKHFEVVGIYEIQRESGCLSKLKNALLRRAGGMTARVEDDIIQKLASFVSESSLDFVFVNHSFFGTFVEKIKYTYPKLYVITFYHNVECNFVSESFKCNKKIGSLLAYNAVFYQEKKLSRYSSLRIVLNSRDAYSLKKNYGIKADHIIPITIVDRFDDANDLLSVQSSFALFVGSDFYANYQGVKWFAEKVSNRISIPLYVVGSGFEKYKKDFAKYPNIKIIGRVDDVSPYYKSAQFVVSPIFYGSGMKTKTAEALMYGKSIIGTPEAFEGFLVDENIGRCCSNSEEFIEAINNNQLSKYNMFSRQLYENLYSPSVFEKKLIGAISNLLYK